MSDQAAIVASSLTKRYGAATAVDDISFAVGTGEIFGLLGPNGAGKTTTILMVLGLTEITRGSVSVLGLDPRREPLRVKRQVGYLPDAVGFYNPLSARDNLAYSGRLMGLARKERDERIAAALKRVGLTEYSGQRVATFSHGMRQRLGLAEIILKDARVAILDEPTSGLDPQATEDLLQLIRELKANGVTVLISSHMLAHMQRICDRVALFQQGRIALMGTVAELAHQVLAGGFEVEVQASGPQVERCLQGIEGVNAVEAAGENSFRLTAVRDVRADAARAVVQGGGTLWHLGVREPSLDAIYSRYFEGSAQTAGVGHAA